MRQLMEQYRDTPMDLADASLVAAVEVLNLRRIFTLDSDFYVYRINNTGVFEVAPYRQPISSTRLMGPHSVRPVQKNRVITPVVRTATLSPARPAALSLLASPRCQSPR